MEWRFPPTIDSVPRIPTIFFAYESVVSPLLGITGEKRFMSEQCFVTRSAPSGPDITTVKKKEAVMTRKTYLTKAGSPTKYFWSSAFAGNPTISRKDANVIVEIQKCGCRKIEEQSEFSHHREYEVCRKHLRLGMLPRRKDVIAVEYYV
jgi:hypothetical protein